MRGRAKDAALTSATTVVPHTPAVWWGVTVAPRNQAHFVMQPAAASRTGEAAVAAAAVGSASPGSPHQRSTVEHVSFTSRHWADPARSVAANRGRSLWFLLASEAGWPPLRCPWGAGALQAWSPRLPHVYHLSHRERPAASCRSWSPQPGLSKVCWSVLSRLRGKAVGVTIPASHLDRSQQNAQRFCEERHDHKYRELSMHLIKLS